MRACAIPPHGMKHYLLWLRSLVQPHRRAKHKGRAFTPMIKINLLKYYHDLALPRWYFYSGRPPTTPALSHHKRWHTDCLYSGEDFMTRLCILPLFAFPPPSPSHNDGTLARKFASGLFLPPLAKAYLAAGICLRRWDFQLDSRRL